MRDFVKCKEFCEWSPCGMRSLVQLVCGAACRHFLWSQMARVCTKCELPALDLSVQLICLLG